VIVTSKSLTAATAGLLLLAAARTPCLAGDAVAAVATIPAPAMLHLVVRHALEAGRLVVRVGPDAFLSAPLKALLAPGHGERLLSVPGGEQTITVQWFDGQGRVLAQKQTRADVSAASPAVLDVGAAMVSGVANLSVSWRERP
jgi:hypothetical protein